jgi:hypothetical protein
MRVLALTSNYIFATIQKRIGIDALTSVSMRFLFRKGKRVWLKKI